MGAGADIGAGDHVRARTHASLILHCAWKPLSPMPPVHPAATTLPKPHPLF